MEVSKEEFSKRIKNLQAKLEQENLDAYLVGNGENFYYLTGLAYRPFERPFFLIVPRSDSPTLMVPKLEEAHARDIAGVGEVNAYWEFPAREGENWFNVLQDLVKDYKSLGVESSLPLNYLRYLPEVVAKDLVEDLRLVKSKKEIEKIAFASEVADRAVEVLVGNSAEGVIALMAIANVSTEVYLKVLGKIPTANLMVTGSTAAVWPAPISAMPHRAPGPFDVIKEGVPNVALATVQSDGYSGECERTFFATSVEEKSKKIFDDVMEARERALETVREGALCSEVDLAAKNFLIEKGYKEYLLHRTGHGIGIGTHEAPWIAEGYDKPLRENMIISIEPGVYIQGYGGFRHSDTVLVKKDGYELLTKYPRELGKLIIPKK
ncbi:MAG: M24 family metallopeptidase [Candidatus Jordarchaeum sp.]|uniref:M24 family metallopeptidase n=1 Tax=Candidatus Jordarchaeum sp. TaxID=2823881 RepID=UPI0040496557